MFEHVTKKDRLVTFFAERSPRQLLCDASRDNAPTYGTSDVGGLPRQLDAVDGATGEGAGDAAVPTTAVEDSRRIADRSGDDTILLFLAYRCHAPSIPQWFRSIVCRPSG